MSIRQLVGIAAVCFLCSTTERTCAADETYTLQYKMTSGEKLRYRVVHMAKTDVRMGQTEDETQVRTASVKAFDITNVTDEGDVTLNHGIESVHMTQQGSDGTEIRWDSTTDELPPARYESVAGKLGQILGTVTFNRYGQVLERSEKFSESAKLGMGDIVVPLPSEPVKIGGKWNVPREVRIKSDNEGPKVIKIREVYTLEKVQTGVATISVTSEPLTAIDSQSERAQLLQQLSNGSIRFDVDAGRMISRQLDWDTNVVGFQGPTSNMEYKARLTEELLDTNEETAALRQRDVK